MSGITREIRPKAIDFPPAFSVVSNQFMITGSGNLVSGPPFVDGVFLGPSSGRVKITWGGAASDDDGTQRANFEFQVFQGVDATGTLLYDVSTARRLTIMGDNNVHPVFESRSRVLDGFLEGVPYFVKLVFSTAFDPQALPAVRIHQRVLEVEPVT